MKNSWLLALLWATQVVAQTIPPGTALVTNYSLDVGSGVLPRQFMTASSLEKEVIANHGPDGTWRWTPRQDQFLVWTTPVPGSLPVCRFFTRPETGATSHFYSVSATECDFVSTNLERTAYWRLETRAAFYLKEVQTDVANGQPFCETGTIPIFRLYNAGSGGAPNHFYTASFRVLEAAKKSGYVLEGAVACGPTVTDKVITANGDAVMLGDGPGNCAYNSTVFDVAPTITMRHVCDVAGIAAYNVMLSNDGRARLPLWSNIAEIDPDSAFSPTPFRWQYRLWSWGVFDEAENFMYISYSDTYTNTSAGVSTPKTQLEMGVGVVGTDGQIRRVYPDGNIGGYMPFYIVLVGDKLYVLNHRHEGGSGMQAASDWVVVLDKHSGERLAQIAVAPHPMGAAYDPRRGRLYVSSLGEVTTGRGAALVAIDVRTDRVVETLTFPGVQPVGLFVDTAADRLWVANNVIAMGSDANTLEVYDLSARMWMTSIAAHWWPTYFGSVFREDGTRELWTGYYGAMGSSALNWGLGRFDLDRLQAIEKRRDSAPGVLGIAGRSRYQ